MKKTFPKVASNSEIRHGKNIYFDAWLYSFMIDNNIAYHMNEQIIASKEQISFMVALAEDEIYIPCSDETFQQLMCSKCSKELLSQYSRAWRIVMRTVRSFETNREKRQRIIEFCRYRFRQFIKNHSVTPSRVMKRMSSLVAALTGVDDPWLARRREANKDHYAMLTSSDMQRALYAKPRTLIDGSINQMRDELNEHEVSRLMYISAMSYNITQAPPSPLEWQEKFEQALLKTKDFFTLLGAEGEDSKTILFLSDTIGGLVFDILLLKRLVRMGHRIIVVVKSGFYFYSPTIQDVEEDPTLKLILDDYKIIHDTNISKNELLSILAKSPLSIIHDGTRERLNLYRVNVTFARAWKEADIILANGWRNASILVKSSQMFTRDIFCYWEDNNGQFQTKAKARATHVRKLSESYINKRANDIIEQMREAHKAHKTIVFYSCIIGSIPGQEATAISLVRAHVDYLRQRHDDTFFINPAEQSPDGMDGDDLMYMWEKVQRSGYINIWRFQTVQDIEFSFELIGRKVSPAWVGKDATFSTGCTKEMHIAIDVQKTHPEMQIIGPDKEKFFRRNSYGVGKFFDERIS